MAGMVSIILTTKNRFVLYKEMSDGYLIMRTPVDNNNEINNLLTIINKKATITTTQ